MQRPIVSVVIPTLNGERTIQEQLRALAGQRTELPYEVIVSDNGSTDGTAGIVHTLAMTYPTTLRRVLATQRKGICHARNVGVISSYGEYVLMCDCDDVVDDDWVQQGWAALQHADLVGGARRILRQPSGQQQGAEIDDRLFGRPGRWAVHGCNFGVRREVYFSVGGFDESLPPYGCDDVEFSFRVASSGYTIAPAPAMIVSFHATGSATRRLRKSLLSAKAEVEVWKRRPEEYSHLLGRARALRELLRLPQEWFRAARRRDKTAIRSTARSTVTRWGHLSAQFRERNSSRPVPILLAPRDDIHKYNQHN